MEDARIYNVRDADGRYLCPCCGSPGAFRGDSYDAKGGVPGTGIFPCCLWEPGYDQPAGERRPADRHRSAAPGEKAPAPRGPAWNGRPQDRPEGWDGRAQIEHLFEVSPDIR